MFPGGLYNGLADRGIVMVRNANYRCTKNYKYIEYKNIVKAMQ